MSNNEKAWNQEDEKSSCQNNQKAENEETESLIADIMNFVCLLEWLCRLHNVFESVLKTSVNGKVITEPGIERTVELDSLIVWRCSNLAIYDFISSFYSAADIIIIIVNSFELHKT